jgi:energy-coupling factor transporter ATP-binding protein EcfA2
MTPQAIVDTAVAEGLGLIAITDHNEITNVATAIAAAEHRPVTVIPGVELSTPQGHLLCYLPTVALLQSFIGRLDIVDRGTQNSRCRNAMLDCLDHLQRLGGFAALAHVDAPSGLEEQVPGFSPHKIDIVCHPAIIAIELKSASSAISYAPGDPDTERVKVGAQRTQKLGLGERQYLARILNSDSHTLNALGRNAKGDKKVTRIKMDTPSFQALRLAFEDGDARVRLEDQIPQSVPHILGAHFEGGFLDGQTIHFSSNLNCIIGGRGTGKSTTFEAVRLLSDSPSDNSVIDSEIWSPELFLFWQDTAGQQHSLQRSIGSAIENTDDPVTGPVTFEIDCFGQGETAKISYEAHSNPLALLNYLDRFVDLHEAFKEENEARDLLLSLQTDIEKAQAQVDQIPQFERALAIVRQQLATLEKAKAKEVIELQRKVEEERAIRTQIIQKIMELKSDLAQKSTKSKLEEICSAADPTRLQLGSNEFREIAIAAKTFETSIAQADGQVRSGLTAFNASTVLQLGAWKAKDAEAHKTIEAKRKELESQNVRLDMAYIQKLAKDEASHAQSVTTLKTWVPHLAELKRKRAQALKARWSARERIATIRDGYARGATRVLHTELTDLKVSLKYRLSGCSPAAEQQIIEALGWRTNQVPRAKLLVENLTVQNLLKAIDDKDISSITGLAFVDGVKPFDTRDAELIFERLSFPAIRYALERCEIHDLPRLSVARVVDDGAGGTRHISRDFTQLSLGQKQSILLALMLSSSSRHPLIIDQPEDNLDSEFIYATLVPVLRRAKERRQIIIVTHNANIAVLGDAEQIIVLKGNNERAKIVSRGSIDDPKTRDFACAILEGAKEAFRQRARTYGYVIQRAAE